MFGRRSTALAITALAAATLGAQQEDSPLTKLRKAGVPEASGPVPVFYPPSVKDRALALRNSLQTAQVWYTKELKLQLPIALVLLDPEMQEIISDRNPAPHHYTPKGDPGLILLPPPGNGPQPAGADREHAPGGILQNEHVLFHEYGHMLAGSLNIAGGNAFVNELVANVFGIAYIQVNRPDLSWLLEDRRSGARTPPRYTSLADFDYLYSGVGLQNMYWFQWQLERLADFLVRDQPLPRVVEKLQQAFPSNNPDKVSLDVIDARFEAVRPGFLKAAGALAEPTTIPRITPSACREAAKRGDSSYVVIRNDTAAPLEIVQANGQRDTIPPRSWSRYVTVVGAVIKLPDGTCLTGREDASLAIIEKLN